MFYQWTNHRIFLIYNKGISKSLTFDVVPPRWEGPTFFFLEQAKFTNKENMPEFLYPLY